MFTIFDAKLKSKEPVKGRRRKYQNRARSLIQRKDCGNIVSSVIIKTRTTTIKQFQQQQQQLYGVFSSFKDGILRSQLRHSEYSWQ
jgi:hypothetical protein